MVKSAAISLLFVLAYGWFLFFADTPGALFSTAAILGVSHVLIPVNIGHDAIHNAVSSKAWVNVLCLYAFEMTGTSSYMYSKKHLEAHRSKEDGSKTIGIETQRLVLQRKDRDGRRNLHPVFYLFFAQYMIFIRDFNLYFFCDERVPFHEYVKLFLSKAIYVFAFVIAPFIFIDFPWWIIVLSLCLMYMVVTLISVVILLMPTEKTEHPRYDAECNVNDAWAVEVLRHNVDFAPNAMSVNLLAGGTNMNAVHYLFPSVCHVHYCHLASLVENVSQKHGLHYRKQKLVDVVKIHVRYIRDIQKTSA